jgi:hypothetical protein
VWDNAQAQARLPKPAIPSPPPPAATSSAPAAGPSGRTVHVVITYDWRVSASKPLLRRLTWLLGPVFAACIAARWCAIRPICSAKQHDDRRR